MSKNLDGIVARIRDVRAQKRPDIEKNLQKIDALLTALHDADARRKVISASSPELAMTLQGVSFNDAENRLLEARAACETALTRLRRESINIGVAGKARQGKSQILQMLTGLGDNQIPTGDGGFCTASRSIVRNGDSQSATVYYLTEAKLLKDKIAPSYAPIGESPVALGLSPQPTSIAAFVATELPSVSDTAPVEAFENWKKVKALQKDLRANPGLVSRLGASPESVPLETVRKYLVKDNGEADYQVVDHVEIVTPFEIDLPKGMTVYDLPGLEDPTPGIRETMLKSVSEDADIVLLLRMPKNTGDDWDTADLRTMNMLKEVYPAEEVQPKDWIQLVLNLDKRPASHNEKNVEQMKDKAPSGFAPVVCDCGSKDKVREMVDANIDALVNQAGRIDDLRIHNADDSFAVAKSAVRVVADAFAAAIGPIVATSGEFDEDGHREKFWGDLRAPFKVAVEKQLDGMQEKFKEELKTAFGAAFEKMERIYTDCEATSSMPFPHEFPVFSKGDLFTFLRGARGTKESIDRAARNQFGAVVELLRNEMKGCCEHLRAIYLENVVQSVTKGNSAIQSLLRSASEQEIGTPEAVFKTLKSRLEEGTKPVDTIVAALDNLLHFDVSYETQLLPYLFDVQEFIDKFDPYSPNSELGGLEKYLNEQFSGNYEAQANVLFNTLKNYSLNWIAPLANSRSEGPCREVSEGIMRVVKANYRNFIAQFVWGEKTEKEWNGYIHSHQDSLWPEDFEKAASRSQLGIQLRDIVALLRKFAS